MSHVHNHEERLSLCKSKHEISHFPIFQTDIVGQQPFNVNIEVYHDLPFFGVAELLLEVSGYFSPQSICGLGPSPLPKLEEVFVNLR